ncbi:MAG: DUF4124 domain-containing protein [Gammaproteobacteria bacterium]|nr:DUF4124 domain-containing protein [Gammaproteobacteria bacterium]
MRLFVYIYLSLALFSAPLQAELYNWVDADGQVHYGDKIPVEDARQERKVLDEKSGRVIQTIERSKTVDELKEKRKRDKIKAVEAEKEQLRKSRDRMLILTYQSVDEIYKARDVKIETIENAIQISRGTLRTQKEQYNIFRSSAADFERSSRVIPKRLLDKMAAAKAKIIRTNNYIERRRREQYLIKKQFTKFVNRYKELTE